MAKSKDLTVWVVVGLIGLLAALWAYPRAFLLLPDSWLVSRGEARVIALERLRDLGEPVADAYVVVRLDANERAERRLLALEEGGPSSHGALQALRDEALQWEVRVFEAGALVGDWTYRARVTLDGRITALERRLYSPLPRGVNTPEQARLEADYVLSEHGFDPASFVAVEETVGRAGDRLDRTFLYLWSGRIPRHGVEVEFSGDVLVGVRRWLEPPETPSPERGLQPQAFLELLRILAVYLFLPAVAVAFARRYHAGEVGVRRAVQILALMLLLSAALLIMTSRGASEGLELGVFSRVQSTWVWGLQFGALLYLPLALIGFLSWSVGESLCRESHGHRLAAFDALFTGRWGNATVAASAVRGTLAGLGLSGMVLIATLMMRPLGGEPLLSLSLGPWWDDAPWAGLALVAWTLVFGLYCALFGRLFLVSIATRTVGPAAGTLLAILVGAVLIWAPGPGIVPIGFSLVLAIVTSAVLVGLFLVYDLLTTFLASCVMTVFLGAFPLVVAESPSVQLQGGLALLVIAMPALLSVRFLASGEQVVYRWDEVPPHVHRIAERERLRLEVETARSIQRSILPELPSRLGEVELAHAYEPAAEVGGDFYEVVPLEDGRLAVAVGDVAGHGVSSGLVMAAVKAALSVQVAADPSVVEVFRTLNRIVFDSAGKRLLTTICYALLDTRRGELSFASAGHLFPFLLGRDGGLLALESVAYPLGVREDLEVAVRIARFEPGDRLVLFSDGLVETLSAETDEPFGFGRLEESLRRHSSGEVSALRDGVLGDIAQWAGEGPYGDDLTLLILALP